MLSEDEGRMLDEMMELAGVKGIMGLHKFVSEHCGESDLDFLEVTLRQKMPKPNGKFKETFILVVNEFVKYAREHGSYNETPASLSRQRINAVVASHFQTTDRTAGRKVGQLIAMGWIEPICGNIRNPIATWYGALESGKPHPGITR